MDKEVDLQKLGFKTGDKVILVDDDWSLASQNIFVVDIEPVPGSTQCLVSDGNDLRTVSRGSLLPA